MKIFQYLKEDNHQPSVERCVGGVELMDLLGLNLTGFLFYEASSAALVIERGVKQAVSITGVKKFLDTVGRQDAHFEVFGCKYKLTVRGKAYLVTKALEVEETSSSLPKSLPDLCKSIEYAGGVAFIGSTTPILIEPIINEMVGLIKSPTCRLFISGGKIACHHYFGSGINVGINEFTDLESAFKYLKNSPIKIIFLEAYSGFEIGNIAVHLSSLGKSVICAELGFSAVYALSNAMSESDPHMLSSLFSGSMYVDVLPVVKGSPCPKKQFGDHEGFLKWGALKTSPKKTEYILTDPVDGALSVAKTELWVSEAIMPSKLVSRWIAEGATSVDMVANLRLEGWLSIADESSIAARDEIVTFDSVLKEVTLV